MESTDVEELAKDLPPLTPKDEREVMRDFEKFKKEAASKLDHVDIEALGETMLSTMKLAKRTAKMKYTPKKYRHGEYWDKHKER